MRPTARLLGPGDLHALREITAVFARAFDDDATYLHRPPSDAYLLQLLSDPSFVAVAGLSDDAVVGGLVGYILRKFEQARSEIYIYDLAVLASHRRQGLATRMIEEVKQVARLRGAYIVYVQADYGDEAAVALYTKLGTREDVMHFDILPAAGEG